MVSGGFHAQKSERHCQAPSWGIDRTAPIRPFMVWMIERGPESFELETRYDKDTSECVLMIHRPNGDARIERFGRKVA